MSCKSSSDGQWINTQFPRLRDRVEATLVVSVVAGDSDATSEPVVSQAFSVLEPENAVVMQATVIYWSGGGSGKGGTGDMLTMLIDAALAQVSL